VSGLCVKMGKNVNLAVKMVMLWDGMGMQVMIIVIPYHHPRQTHHHDKTDGGMREIRHFLKI
jgi:hypothetical protein